MDNQDTTENVVSLFKRKAAAVTTAEQKDATAEAAPQQGESFEEVMARNARNRERMAKERNTANKSVLRSYKIKN